MGLFDSITRAVRSSVVGSAIFGSAEDEANAIRRKGMSSAARAELEMYNKTQAILKKSKEEAVTDVEAANLKASGIISDAEEAAITRLNATEKGAIATMKEFSEKADTIFASTEELILKDLSDSGIMAREDFNKSTNDAIQSIIGYNDKAVEAFKPYTEAGKRGIERTQFLSGLLDENERAEHLERFGSVEGSPLFEFRKKEQTEALRTRQKAIGRVFSGEGALEEVGLVDKLSAEEAERQLGASFNTAQLGFNAATNVAGLQQQTGQRLGQLQQQRGVNLANQSTQQGQNMANIRGATGLNRANLQRQLGSSLTDVQLSLASARSQVRNNSALNRARLAEGQGSSLANIRLGTDVKSAELASLHGQNTANRIQQQANLDAQSVINQQQQFNQQVGQLGQFAGFLG